MRRRLIAILVASAALTSGCGSGHGSAARIRDATLVLDFTPNAIHTGIYAAVAHGYDRDQRVRLHVVAPSASTDSIKLLEAGRANFAILDIHDLAIAREHHQDIVGIMAIVERPLAAVIAAPQIGTPRRLEGKTVGVTGVPSDTAVLRSVLAGAGGDPATVKTITIGFNAVAALLAHRVAAATGFWNDEGVTLQHRDPGFRIFRVDAYGAPSYPELVLCATRAALRDDPTLARAVVRALVRGYRLTLADPRAGAAALQSEVPALDPSLVNAQLSAEIPAFTAPDGRFGELNLTTLEAWSRWEAKFGIVARPPVVSQAFDPGFTAP